MAPHIAAVVLGVLASFPAWPTPVVQDGADWPEGSAMHTAYLMSARRDAADIRLQAAHETLLAQVKSGHLDHMGTRLPSALQDAHLGWQAYRTPSCELFGAATGAGGLWPTVQALECEHEVTEQRLRAVQSALACIRELPADEREAMQGDCLFVLAPRLPSRGE